jgi:hypothetical protein
MILLFLLRYYQQRFVTNLGIVLIKVMPDNVVCALVYGFVNPPDHVLRLAVTLEFTLGYFQHLLNNTLVQKPVITKDDVIGIKVFYKCFHGFGIN